MYLGVGSNSKWNQNQLIYGILNLYLSIFFILFFIYLFFF